jgi:hypothetical protein
MSEPTPSRMTPGRVVAIVSGSIAALLAFGALAVGAVLLWGEAHKDSDGYVSTGTDRFHTRTYALATDDLDVDTDAPDWLFDGTGLGHIRVRATSNDGKPVFVGIARSRDVAGYLNGTGHATVSDVDYSPFRASYDTRSGERPAPPVLQRFWTVSSSGKGRQAVEWKVRQGSWSVVVMNADGSKRVDAGVSVGADAPWLGTAGWSAIGGGALLMALAGGLIYVGARRPREQAPPAGLAPAAA